LLTFRLVAKTYESCAVLFRIRLGAQCLVGNKKQDDPWESRSIGGRTLAQLVDQQFCLRGSLAQSSVHRSPPGTFIARHEDACFLGRPAQMD
jgi:hypothetical protein